MILFSSHDLSTYRDDEEDVEAEDAGIDDDLLQELEEDDIDAEEDVVEGEPFPLIPPEDEEEEDEDENGLDDEFLGGKVDPDEDEEDMDYDSFDDEDEL